MNITDRLRGIVKPARVLLEPGGHARPEVPHVPRSDAAGHHEPGLDAVLGGSWQCNVHGARSYIVERRQPADARHGRVEIGAMAETLRRAEREAPLLANGAPARLPFVFFDLETTGLSGGAGTYAFLVGLGWFDERGAFVTRQHLLSRPTDERLMLQAVGRHLDAAGAIVSFNGRSFDAPLLESRFLYHRLSWPAGRLPHVDMLHPARRFWRSDTVDGQSSSCSLGVLERQLIGAPRLDDVPGFEAPARYFQFVRTGDARALAGVLEHNRRDLLSLAALTVRLLRLVNEGAEAATDAREAVALGRVFERAGLPGRAVEAYERALTIPQKEGPVSPGSFASAALRAEAIRALALLARRARRYDDAAAHWRQLLEMPECPLAMAREASEALAIHHEHRTRDFDAAHEFAVRTIGLGRRSARGRDVFYRLARIDRKRAAVQHVRPNPFGELPFA